MNKITVLGINFHRKYKLSNTFLPNDLFYICYDFSSNYVFRVDSLVFERCCTTCNFKVLKINLVSIHSELAITRRNVNAVRKPDVIKNTLEEILDINEKVKLLS
jgi:hypothetical protein